MLKKTASLKPHGRVTQNPLKIIYIVRHDITVFHDTAK